MEEIGTGRYSFCGTSVNLGKGLRVVGIIFVGNGKRRTRGTSLGVGVIVDSQDSPKALTGAVTLIITLAVGVGVKPRDSPQALTVALSEDRNV